MGLDMNLTAKKFFWTDWKKGKTAQNEEAETIKKMFPEMKGNKLSYVTFDVGYWRKANAIHKWFVDNVQDGEDDCRTYYVSREKLKELKRVCEEVIKIAIVKKGKINNGWSMENGKKIYHEEDGEYIANAEDVADILPTTSGFFFGTTEYDQYYLNDVKDTIQIINKCLALSSEWDFDYYASW